MSIQKSGQYFYAESAADIEEAIKAFPEVADMKHFRQAVCKCRNAVFRLYLDEDAGYCIRECTRCSQRHVLVDGEDLQDEAVPEAVMCVCDFDQFEVTGAVSVYDDSPDDARQFALGCRCAGCGIAGVYAIWMARWCGDEDEPGWSSYLALL